jgi:RNA polymerase sigma-70 factor (ECF subfamily)
VRLLKTQGESEFERNVLRHLDASYNLARWLLGNPHDAEDVVQDSAVRAYTSYKSFRGTDAKAWFLAIVRNGCMNRLRQRSTHLSIDLTTEEARIVDDRPSPEQLAIKAWEADALQAAIDALSIEYREMIILRELEGLSYKEIATVTELPIGTVMSRLARARSCLQRELCASEGGTR